MVINPPEEPVGLEELVYTGAYTGNVWSVMTGRVTTGVVVPPF